MNAIDYIMLDDEETNRMAGRRRKEDGMKTGPVPLSRPAGEDGKVERDPEDTRDMLWMYLERQNAVLDRNFAHQTEAIDACTHAVEDISDKLGEHLEVALKAQAEARIEEVRITDAARSRDQRLAALLGALLIIGLLVLAGASVSGKYGGAEISAGHGGQ